MKFNVSLTGVSAPTPQPQPDIVRTLIRWDSPIAIKDGYSTYTRGAIGQFAMCPLYLTDQAGIWLRTWSANSLATRLTNLQQIAALQVPDASFTVNQKMGWLCASSSVDGWGSPINTLGQDWQTAQDVRMIAAVYAGQPVSLTGETMTRQVELQGNINFEKLWRVKAYDPAQWTRDNCQLVTAVSAANNYTEFTKGKIYLPVYFGGDRKAYILDRWLA